MPDPERPILQLPERPYAGQIIFHGTTRGRITMVDDRAGTVSVEWEDGNFPVVYPTWLKCSYPWE
jgi:hypothetical protein